MDLQKVAYIISTLGFELESLRNTGNETNYYIKEIGIFNTASQQIALFRLRLPVILTELTDEDRVLALKATNTLHGIEYKNLPADVPYTHITNLLRWIATKSNDKEHFIAYNGDPYERHLLLQAKAKNICDLQLAKIPPFEQLYNQDPYRTIVSSSSRFLSTYTHINCPHKNFSQFKIPACAAILCQYYAAWILHHYGPFSTK